ncbi:MAG TPA: single-stranded-DNA-specific exonuclease RecJ [Deltaproteobacteria bacterium]|nr:single-stranded-DNA-specific exonuclease RecJ [Deltaproteobacteria bacterium]
MVCLSPEWVIRGQIDRNILPELKFSPIFRSLMRLRGMDNPDEILSFLTPNLGQLRDPRMMKDMDKACNRISRAIEHKEIVGVFTDYDVDGVCSAALIYRFVVSLGQPPPVVFIPDRAIDGYGLNIRGIEELHKQGASLLITADCGITGCKEVDYANALGMDVIITDHHELGDELPKAYAVINPKQSGCPFGGEDLCGAGVVFHLIVALRSLLRDQGMKDLPNLRGELDLVAMATVADVVALSGINRILVKEGLNVLNTAARVGISALARVSGINRKLFSRDIGFILGPRINAAGRVSDARKAFELLTTQDEREAQSLANELNELNRHRQIKEQKVLKEVLLMLDQGSHIGKVIVVAGTDWHTGVIGIVASRLTSVFSRPAIVISIVDGIGIGSGRSVDGVDLHTAVSSASEFLNEFGGHKMAVGLNIDESKIIQFAGALDRLVEDSSGEKESYEVDLKISPFDITPMLLDELDMLGPFGDGNPEPVFMIPSMEIVGKKRYAKGQFKLFLKHSNRVFHTLRCSIDLDSKELPKFVDVAFTPVKMMGGGHCYLYLSLKAISPV